MKTLLRLASLALLAPALAASPPAAPAAPAAPAGSGAPATPGAPGSTTPGSTAPGSTAPAATAPAAPAVPPAVPAGPAPVNAVKTTAGLTLSADLREAYVAGYPLLVTITVRNESDAPVVFPDLAARPHLVRFTLKQENRTWQRYSTPPAVEPTDTWTIAPRAQRKVLLEIPSTAGLDPGAWQLGLDVLDPAGTVSLPLHTVTVAPAKVAGGSYTYEATIQQTVGAMLPWVQQGPTGFDLYMLQFDAHAPTHVIGNFFLTHLKNAVEPLLTRARPADASSRYLYWQTGGSSFALARLDGTGLRGAPRTVSLPYPKVEPLGRGATDAKGGAILPLWIPAPKGDAGTVRALCVDERGGQVLRDVATLPARPTLVATSIDAGSNLLLVLGHAAAVDLYRIDPSLPPEIGAHGARVTTLTDGWTAAGFAFDTLPDRADHPGGLALFTLLTKPGSPQGSYRTLWSDLGGKALLEGAPLPWSTPGTVVSVLPAGFGPFSYLTQDAAGKVWFGTQGSAAHAVDGAGPGTLWPSAEGVQLRRTLDGRVFEDRVLGATTP